MYTMIKTVLEYVGIVLAGIGFVIALFLGYCLI